MKNEAITIDEARELAADPALWPRVRDFLWDFVPQVHPSWWEGLAGECQKPGVQDAAASAVDFSASGSQTEVMIHDLVTNIFAAVYLYFQCMLIGTMVAAAITARYEPKKDKDFIIVLGCGLKKDGTPTPLQQVSNVSVPEARIIQIAPWDKNMIKEKSIRGAGWPLLLGLLELLGWRPATRQGPYYHPESLPKVLGPAL